LIATRALLAAVLVSATAALSVPARGQTLIVPLTGKRHRTIDAATLFHTLFGDFFLEDDATTYVQTGDIPAMWLRDSAAQTIPYVRFEPFFPVLKERTTGVIEREAREIAIDPYANAFRANYAVFERKWEVDSLAWPVLLAWVYWRTTGDAAIFTGNLHKAFELVVSTYECEERHAQCSRYSYPRGTFAAPEFNQNAGLIWSAFRPSDDAVHYRFNIPQNAIAVVALRDLATMARTAYGDGALAERADALAQRVDAGIAMYGRVYDARYGWLYVYETDGFGRDLLMDDANVPDLLSLPYLGWCSAYDPTYVNTRNFVLSRNNPYFYSGRYAEGLGSPHTPAGNIWPLGIITRALTSTSTLEVATAVTTLAQTDSETPGLIHESFYADGYWRYTRSDFGWANALYAELIFRAVAGDVATPFVSPGTVVPFEIRTQTPALVPPVVQLENETAILNALGRLLEPISQF
jgi:meiotically up-regulated gene 157 (Mug157) protein